MSQFESTVRITVIDGTTRHETAEGKGKDYWTAEGKALKALTPDVVADYLNGYPILPHEKFFARVLGDLYDYEVRLGSIC